MEYYSPPDKFERHLQKVAPEHVGGYREGWLVINSVELDGHYFHHIYSKTDGFISTLVEF